MTPARVLAVVFLAAACRAEAPPANPNTGPGNILPSEYYLRLPYHPPWAEVWNLADGGYEVHVLDSEAVRVIMPDGGVCR